jgi:hypothetical protein
MVFKILLCMMGVTSVLLVIRDARHRAQAKRAYKQLKTIIEHGKDERKAEEAEGTGDNDN